LIESVLQRFERVRPILGLCLLLSAAEVAVAPSLWQAAPACRIADSNCDVSAMIWITI